MGTVWSWPVYLAVSTPPNLMDQESQHDAFKPSKIMELVCRGTDEEYDLKDRIEN